MLSGKGNWLRNAHVGLYYAPCTDMVTIGTNDCPLCGTYYGRLDLNGHGIFHRTKSDAHLLGVVAES